MDSDSRTLDPEAWEQLLRRAHAVVEHHRYHRQPIDAREVVGRVLATYPSRAARIVQYRALLEEAVDSLIRGFR
ncbi:MAG: hypothetical protein JWM53_5274 [bacterium]|nr:hypothetical protein [bacterium]